MSCENKPSYKTYDEAIAAKVMANQQGRDVRFLKPYRCREANCANFELWHLGHSYS